MIYGAKPSGGKMELYAIILSTNASWCTISFVTSSAIHIGAMERVLRMGTSLNWIKVS
jgi:hypothetical protein